MKKVLIASYIDLFPVNAGNRKRIFDMIEMLRQNGYDVYYLYYNSFINRHAKRKTEAYLGKKNSFFYLGEHYGYKARRYLRKKFDNNVYYAVDELIPYGLLDYVKEVKKKINFDIVIAEYVMSSKILTVFGKDTLKIIDTHDILTDRNKIFEGLGIKPTGIFLKKGQEVKGLQRADVVLAIQNKEACILKKWLKNKTRVVMVGNNIQEAEVEVKQSRKVLFLGSGNLLNQNGAKWFIKEVLPIIKEKNIEILFAGKVCNGIADSKEYHKLGFVDDLAALYREVQIVINPIQGGTGLNIKTVEALGYAKPLVTTSVGAKGLPNAERIMRIADTPEKFAQDIVELIEDIDECKVLSEQAHIFVQNYNKVCKKRLMEVLNKRS